MSLICPVDYGTALKYKGLSLKTKWNGKNHPVYLKLMCDDTNILEGINLAKVSRNIVMIDYQGLETSPVYSEITSNLVGNVYVGRLTEFGNDLRADDIERLVSTYPSGVVPILKLPNDFKDLELLCRLSIQFPNIRFCGGELFAVDGIKVGAVGVDILDAKGAKYSIDSYYLLGETDVLPTVDIETLTIETVGRVEKKPKSSKSSTSTTTKKKSSSVKKKSFGAMMMAMGCNNNS